MKETLASLQKRRVTVLSVNLLYFLALAALGFFLFFRSRSTALFAAALAALAVYLLLVRPMTEDYKRAVRRAVLEFGVCGSLSEFTYEPKAGFSAAEFLTSGLVNTVSDKAFFSREKVTARRGDMRLAMSDVTFPIRERGLNAMSSGLYLRLTRPGAAFPALTVRAGDAEDLPVSGKAAALLREMASFVPGNLYLNTVGDTMHVFFRGRFIGFRINPLLQLTEKTLRSDPLPEAEQSLRLALMLSRKDGVQERI